MSENNRVKVNKMKRGQFGIVEAIEGGQSMRKKLEDIGIRIGKKIVKICNQPLSGPVQIKVDNIQVAIGHRMASRIEVSIVDALKCD
ncbi:MAG: ferrous iron transport protein A [Candidatus Zixiibacteriota bacterium]